MTQKIPFFKISKNKKLSFFLMSQGSFSPKIRFLSLKECSVAQGQTDRQESENRGHPFKVSGSFLKTIIKDRSNTQTIFGNRSYKWKVYLNTLFTPDKYKLTSSLDVGCVSCRKKKKTRFISK